VGAPAVVRGVMLLLVRGILLWLLVPAGACVWLIAAVPVWRRQVGLGQFLGWLDLNLVALLERTILRPFFRTPRTWTPWQDVDAVGHHIGFLDPA